MSVSRFLSCRYWFCEARSRSCIFLSAFAALFKAMLNRFQAFKEYTALSKQSLSSTQAEKGDTVLLDSFNRTTFRALNCVYHSIQTTLGKFVVE